MKIDKWIAGDWCFLFAIENEYRPHFSFYCREISPLPFLLCLQVLVNLYMCLMLRAADFIQVFLRRTITSCKNCFTKDAGYSVN